MSEWITLDTHHGPVRAWQALPDPFGPWHEEAA